MRSGDWVRALERATPGSHLGDAAARARGPRVAAAARARRAARLAASSPSSASRRRCSRGPPPPRGRRTGSLRSRAACSAARPGAHRGRDAHPARGRLPGRAAHATWRAPWACPPRCSRPSWRGSQAAGWRFDRLLERGLPRSARTRRRARRPACARRTPARAPPRRCCCCAARCSGCCPWARACCPSTSRPTSRVHFTKVEAQTRLMMEEYVAPWAGARACPVPNLESLLPAAALSAGPARLQGRAVRARPPPRAPRAWYGWWLASARGPPRDATDSRQPARALPPALPRLLPPQRAGGGEGHVRLVRDVRELVHKPGGAGGRGEPLLPAGHQVLHLSPAAAQLPGGRPARGPGPGPGRGAPAHRREARGAGGRDAAVGEPAGEVHDALRATPSGPSGAPRHCCAPTTSARRAAAPSGATARRCAPRSSASTWRERTGASCG